MEIIPVGGLVPNPRQPRSTIQEAELKELADSIRQSGVLQPILARRTGGGLEIVAGERRWRAARQAGLTHVPVVIRETSDGESAVFALVENLQREDLNPLDKAKAFRQLLDLLKTSQEELAQRVGLDRSTVTNFVRLLDLAPAVQEHVSRGTISMGHARCLLTLPHARQVELADRAIRDTLSVRSLEDLVRSASGAEPAGTARGKGSAAGVKRAAWIKEIEESLCEVLGTPTAVRYGRNRSVITITCGGREEFERVLKRLRGD